ncbi:hypothetical protein RJT34_02748 [Clitoria ternatea]|uniref:Uncharacterized protein n=1 Tax=Clitoria ternatea TaxID=43366 RepID=A0AAN9Q0J4_CLITE
MPCPCLAPTAERRAWEQRRGMVAVVPCSRTPNLVPNNITLVWIFFCIVWIFDRGGSYFRGSTEKLDGVFDVTIKDYLRVCRGKLYG